MKKYYAHNFIRAIRLLKERMDVGRTKNATFEETLYIAVLYQAVVFEKNRSVRLTDIDMKIMNNLWKRLKHAPVVIDLKSLKRRQFKSTIGSLRDDVYKNLIK